MASRKLQKRDVNAAPKAALAIQLRAQKLPYHEIAQRCGYDSKASAYNAVQRELQRTVVENVEELRREESAMLDQLHAVCWKLAMDEENKGRLFAIDRILAISERRAKLFGLDMKSDDPILQQNYVKKIVLTHVQPAQQGVA